MKKLRISDSRLRHLLSPHPLSLGSFGGATLRDYAWHRVYEPDIVIVHKIVDSTGSHQCWKVHGYSQELQGIAELVGIQPESAGI